MNDFNFSNVQRFYQVENHQPNFIRAWHGHTKEAKYVYVVRGAAIIQTLSYEQAGSLESAKPERFVLSAENPRVLYIPPQHYNGFMNLTVDTIVIFFSTSTLKDSLNDDFRMPVNAVSMEGWKIESR